MANKKFKKTPATKAQIKRALETKLATIPNRFSANIDRALRHNPNNADDH